MLNRLVNQFLEKNKSVTLRYQLTFNLPINFRKGHVIPFALKTRHITKIQNRSDLRINENRRLTVETLVTLTTSVSVSTAPFSLKICFWKSSIIQWSNPKVRRRIKS
jgi:hypothetical protein